jgi:glycosyltransferase involved in cell wall biosynthesis
MRILVFNWQDIKNPLAGGAEVHLHEVFERIAAMGHQVTLFCSMFPGAQSEEDLNGIRIIRKGGRHLFNLHVPVAYFARFRRAKFDIVIDDVNKIPFYTPLFVREPLLGINHHLFDKSIFLEVPFPFALYVYLAEQLVKPIYRRIHFIVGSPSTFREFAEWGFPKDQMTVISYCVNHELYRQTGIPKSDTPLIGYFGRLKKYKSVEHLIRAFDLVRKQIPEARVMIVGEGDNRKVLENLTRDLGLSEFVEFRGFVSDEDKVKYLQQMHFVVNTSSKEGWGLTVVEANACGTCVIAANVPGLKDSVVDGETGLLYEYGNIQELSEKIVYLIRNPDVRERLSEGAVRWARSFDWNVAANHTMEIIRKTVSPGKK